MTRIGKPQLVRKERHGQLFLVEERPLRLAKIPLNGVMKSPLQDCIIVHPRYALKADHEIIEVEGRRNGRTIEVLLEEPLEIDGKKYGVLCFKGTGANADREMVIHPELYFRGDPYSKDPKSVNFWTIGDIEYNRIWGAIEKSSAENEFNNPVLPALGVPFSPQIRLNQIPAPILEAICELEKTTNGIIATGPVSSSYTHAIDPRNLNLSQIVRAFRTNIRLEAEDLEKLKTEDRAFIISPRELAQIDCIALNAVFELVKRNKTLYGTLNVAQNRFIDGTFTDGENYVIKHARNLRELKENAMPFLEGLAISSRICLGYYPANGEYSKIMMDKLGITINENDGDLVSVFDAEFDKRTIKKVRQTEVV